ncbi:MAG: 4-(cytidine 5'-diphospho)-2-C-methyl-D-erythritol kinase [Actinomycetota bacterium]|nr:4-(cytidine 5'-diphospho)-2-C-methyl-D-erythritol kinase [Actinomycetota bacterium]
MRFRANAKINLFLRVLGDRPDGFHEIESILHSVDLGDEMEISIESGSGIDVEMILEDGVRGPAPPARSNLIYWAAERMLELSGYSVAIKVVTRKRIPMGGGLGGGSADAAGTLVALNEMLGVGLDVEDLGRLGAAIGSDVPFCIAGGTALATSRGEVLTALPAPARLWFVLGMSRDPVQTHDVYARWRPSQESPPADRSQLMSAIGVGDPAEIAPLLLNDLEPYIFELRPDVRSGTERMVKVGALGSLTSGSGPTVFGIASDEAHAQGIADRARGEFDRVQVVGSRPEGVERLD